MWERVTSGQSGAAMFRGRRLYRKVTPDAETEAATMSWLRARGLPVAEVVDIGPDWIVTQEITGMTAADPWPEDRRSRVIDALSDMTLALHALPVDECPFDRSPSELRRLWSVVLGPYNDGYRRRGGKTQPR